MVKKITNVTHVENLFSVSGSLKKHINSVHNGLKDLKCDLCSKAFTESWTLKKHMDALHKE